MERDPGPLADRLSAHRIRPALRLTLLGAFTGLASGAVVLAFRWTLDTSQSLFLPGGKMGNYEALPPWAVFCLPILGGVLLGLVFERLSPGLRAVGIVHVIQQLRHSGRPSLPIRNAVAQFFGGAFAIVTGHSVDREGPQVHLGAATASLLGRNCDEAETFTLTAAGAAAAIAAAFNTPLAGVAFVIEVLGVRYRVDRFIPIVTAAVAGALMGRAAYGPAPSFRDVHVLMGGLYELPLVAALGLVSGLLGAAFIALAQGVQRRAGDWRPALAFTSAGLLTGTIGLVYPQVLGVGYDTLDAILAGRLVGPLLAGLALAKLAATAVSVGLRVPAGLIGPSLVIGGAAGGFAGWLAQSTVHLPTGGPSFYANLGMLATMSAVLRAPLAAMLALLELTGRPELIFPGMTAVVAADLVARQVLGLDSVFEHLRRLVARREAGEPVALEPAEAEEDR